jgi:YHS domain-containing protein
MCSPGLWHSASSASARACSFANDAAAPQCSLRLLLYATAHEIDRMWSRNPIPVGWRAARQTSNFSSTPKGNPMTFYNTRIPQTSGRIAPIQLPAFQQLKTAGLTAGRFVLHFVEMSIAMIVGMVLFMTIPGVMELPRPLHLLGMAIAMTAPMVGWMHVRGHGWRHGLEMSIGMLLPWAAVLGLVALGAASVLPWLAQADGPAMFVGMLAVMLLRPGHYAHATCHAHGAESMLTDPVCGMAVAPQTAKRTAEYAGQTYYFCAPACRKSFLTDPARFVAASA